MKTSVPFKVSLGYAIVVAVLGLAVWLVYGNTRTLMGIDRARQEMTKRRNTADSLVYALLEMSNSERAVCLGRGDEWQDYESLVARSVALADSLASLTDSRRQHSRIDSLKAMIMLKRENTLLIMQDLALNSPDRFFREKVNSLQRGGSPVVIHPKTAETHEDKEVVYNIVQTRKGFFARLADAFRRQRQDTVAMHSLSRRTKSDTATHSIDIADSVADVLTDIKREEELARLSHRRRLALKAQTQQMAGVEINRRIAMLLGDIRNDEQRAIQTAVQRDMDSRVSVMVKVIVLALTAVVMAVVLLLFVMRDIRRNRAYQQSLMEAKAETERIMAQRERLLLTITHDIKAPAASISGFIELLRALVTGKKAASYLDNIRSSAQHLLQLVSALLDYHRLESGKTEVREVSFSAAQLVGGCAEAMRPQAAAKGLSLSCDTSGCGGDLCRGDAFRIKQVLDNLLSNAVKYTMEGGITVTAAERAGKLVVEVTDTGRGMTREESRRVFDAFTRLPGAQGTEGVGLGLSITREIVSLLGGRIYLSSFVGRGTTFRVVIPVVKDGEGQPSSPPAAAVGVADKPVTGGGEAKAAALAGTMKILIVDDDRLQRQLLTEMLGGIGGGRFTVTSCAGPTDALRRFESDRPDVFFIDIEMPEMPGTEVVSRIGSHGSTRLIAMTAHEPDIEPELLRAGFSACLFKPFTTERLSAVLSAVTGCGFSGGKAVAGNSRKDDDGGGEDDGDSGKSGLGGGEASAGCGAHGRFGKLFEFADGDETAVREIASSFRDELDGHVSALLAASKLPDRDIIARTAHKAAPLLKMAGTAAEASLSALSPEHIGSLSDGDVRLHCEKVVADMREIRRELALRYCAASGEDC